MADFSFDIPDYNLSTPSTGFDFGGGGMFEAPSFDFGNSFDFGPAMPTLDFSMPQAPAFGQQEAPSFQDVEPLTGGGGGGAKRGGGFGDWWGSMSTPGKLGALLAGGTAVAGLAGALQQAFGGGQQTKATTKVQHNVPPPSAQEQQLAQQAGQGTDPQLLAALNQIAQNQLMLAQIQQNNMAVGQQAPQVAGQQADILSALAPTAQGFAQGQMLNSDEINRTIEQAFQPAMGSINAQAIENARARGWAGGADLLQGPAGALAGPALADLQGQMAKAKLEYGLALPQVGAQLAGAYNQPIQTRMDAGMPGLQQGNTIAQILAGMSRDDQNRVIQLLDILQRGRLGQGSSITTQLSGPQGGNWAQAAGTLGDTMARLGSSVGGMETNRMMANQMAQRDQEMALLRDLIASRG